MRTLILTGSDDEMLSVLDLTLPSKQAYCKRHNYDLLSLRSFPADKECNFESRHIGFIRVATAFKLLKFYDNVMWVDADSIITNTDYKIEDFITGTETFIASYDWMWYNSFSSGNFIVRRTPDAQQLFNRFLAVSRYRLNDIMQDQGALNQIFNESVEYRKMFNVLHHRFLGSVPALMVDTITWRNDNNRSGIINQWNPDCFLAHLTGATASDRIDILTNNKLNLK